MRIVHINSVCDVGSTGRIAANICRETMKDGNECLIAYGRGVCNSTDIDSIRIGNDFDVIVHGILSRCFDLHGFGSKHATLQFLKKIDNFKPDIMYLHNLHGYYINIELLFDYIKKNKIKVFWTLHDAWSFTGHCAWDETYNCDQWKNGCKKCKNKDKYPKCDLLGNSKRNFKRKRKAFVGVEDLTIVVPSEWLGGLVKESFLREYPIVVKHNTIDKTIFHKIDSQFREKNSLIGYSLYLCVVFASNEKKLDDLFSFSNMLEESERLVIVGLNQKRLKQAMSYPKLVPFARTDSREELAQIYSACDVYVNPTYADNYPTVNLEAEACGTPVICYDVGGCRETLKLPFSKCIQVGNLELLLSEAREVIEKRKNAELQRKDENIIFD